MTDDSAEKRGKGAPHQSGVETLGARLETPVDRGPTEWIEAVRGAQIDRLIFESPLSAGGMGEVQRVVDRPLVRSIARKVLHEHLASQSEPTEMFIREARLTGQLDHPNIVPVHELGIGADGRLYFTMKLVQGRTLKAWIDTLPAGDAIERGELFDLLDVVLRVCDALAFAHSRGVLHCDVKPANVMVGDFGQVYLMDWGVARLIEEERARTGIETEERVVGTTTHMPPEQARGEPLDVRADVFAVGALLYEILTRRPPYRGETHVQVLAQAFLCRYPHPDDAIGRGVVPAPLTRIVLRAMAKDRTDRYASVLELKDELLRFVRGGEAFEAIAYEPGQVVVREGEPGNDAFIIESGACEVTRRRGSVDEVIRVMGPGEVFGEMAILSPGVRTASVRTIERTVLRRVTSDALRSELESMKPWMGLFVRTLAERFREREGERR